ncbi:hypothetical protein BaRGS_00040279 [Batillaria attramentaria]|uniref:G-protein coupled receptors family 1 profile domain-containing protein n=1 Tax=Batillaria attramentaria TaxID=370345 RepID=A0ABD0J0Q2_9CAEN
MSGQDIDSFDTFPNGVSSPNLCNGSQTPSNVSNLLIPNDTASLPESVSPNPDMSENVLNTVDSVGEELMSEEVYTSANLVLGRVVYSLQALALVSNVINVLVMTRRSMRSSASRYLVSMSVVQLIYIVLLLVPTVHGLLTPRVMTDVFYLAYTIYVKNYVMSCLRRVLYVLHCLVSVERLLAVLLPLKAKNYVIVMKPVIFIVVTPIVIFIAHIHVALKLEVEEVVGEDNSTFHSYRYTDLYLRHPHLFSTLNVASKVIFVYGTLLFLVVANVVLIVALRIHAAKRRQMDTNINVSAARRRERQMTVTILVSTLIFTVLCLPTVSNSVVYNLVPESYGPFTTHRYLFQFVQSLGGACYVLAFSSDFFTYVSLSSAYRNTLLRMVKRMTRRGAEDVTKTSVSGMSVTQVTSAPRGGDDEKY